jgi:hypothetical protein
MSEQHRDVPADPQRTLEGIALQYLELAEALIQTAGDIERFNTARAQILGRRVSNQKGKRKQ